MSKPARAFRLPALCAVLALLVLPPLAQAGVRRWTPFGPPAGEIGTLVADPFVPSLLYVAPASGRVHRSLDGGVSWSGPLPGLPSPITALAPDPLRAGRIWAAGADGVFRSDDHGVRWSRASAGDFQPFPQDGLVPSRVLLAAVPGRHGGDASILFYAGHGLGPVWRSLDGGRSWSTTTAPEAPVFLKTDARGRIYAGSLESRGIWRSPDGGETWQPLAPLPGEEDEPVDLEPAPSRPDLLYAAARTAVYRSRDGGAVWRRVLTVPADARLTALAADPRSPGTVYAAMASCCAGTFWRSDDAGGSWRQAADPPVSGVILHLLVEPGRRVIHAASHWDLASSADRGRTWSYGVIAAALASRLQARDRLRFDPRDPSRVYAVAGGNLFASGDGGGTWRAPTRDFGLQFARLNDVAFDPVRAGFLYAATESGLLLSKDRGATWTRLSTNPDPIHALVFVDRATLLAAGPALSRSTDRGRTWTQTLPVPAGSAFRDCDELVSDPADPRHVFAACLLMKVDGGQPYLAGRELWQSRDGGVSWLPLPDVERVAFASAESGTLYGWLPVAGWLFQSLDGGGTWNPAGHPDLSGLEALLADPRSAGVLYAAGGYPGEVYRSQDGGATWEPVRAGLRGLLSGGGGLFVHPVAPHRVYLAAGDHQLFVADFPEE